MGQVWTAIKNAGNGISSLFMFILNSVEAMARLVVEMFTGDAASVYGYAPFITLPGFLLIPFQASFPGSADLITSPLLIMGITQSTITYYELISAVYWIMLAIYTAKESSQLNAADNSLVPEKNDMPFPNPFDKKRKEKEKEEDDSLKNVGIIGGLTLVPLIFLLLL